MKSNDTFYNSNIDQFTGSSRLMRISLMQISLLRFFKTITTASTQLCQTGNAGTPKHTEGCGVWCTATMKLESEFLKCKCLKFYSM